MIDNRGGARERLRAVAHVQREARRALRAHVEAEEVAEHARRRDDDPELVEVARRLNVADRAGARAVVALAVVCVLSLVAWITTTMYFVRAIGLASGAGALYFIYGGFTGLKEERG